MNASSDDSSWTQLKRRGGFRDGDLKSAGLILPIGILAGWIFDITMGVEVPHSVALSIGTIGQAFLSRWFNGRDQ